MKLRTRPSIFRLSVVFLIALPGNLRGGDALTPNDSQADVAAQQQEIASLIEQLGSQQYAARRRAERRLTEFGFEAFDALKSAEDHDDLEVATRARYLIQLISVELTRPHDPPKVRSRLKLYADGSVLHRLGIIERLARMPHDAGLEALCRIVRYEKSQELSKHAALTIIAVHSDRDEAFAPREKTIRTVLGRSGRPGAQWLLAYLQTCHDPQAGQADWERFVRTEQMSVSDDSSESHDDLLPSLLYTIGGLYLDLSNQQTAEKFSGQAFHAAEGTTAHHLNIANVFLIRHGRFDWAEREYRHVLEVVHPDSAEARNASYRLANMFHDQLQDLAGATVLREAIGKNTKKKRILPSTRATMEYYLAEHFARQSDRAKQREHLDRAVALDPTNADVLIAMYRLPDADDAYRAETLRLIKKAADEFEKEIKTIPNATSFNQWAWLISNTEGNFEQAIQSAHKSVRAASQLTVHPQIGVPYTAGDEAGYLDTLGHCYYAKGDYENAVKYQQQAAGLMPHSKIIGRQLNVFKKALAER